MIVHLMLFALIFLVAVYLNLNLNSTSIFKFKSNCFFSFFFPPPLLSFGPSPAGPSSPLPFFFSFPWQPGPRPFSSSSFSPLAQPANSPVQPSSSRTRPLFLSLSSFLPSRGRGPFPRPGPIRAPPLPRALSLSPSLALAGGPHLSGSSPPPRPSRTRARVRARSAPPRHLRLGSARPGIRGRPYLSATNPLPALTLAAATARSNPSRRRRFAVPALGRRRTADPPPPAADQPPPRLRAVVRTLAGPSFSFPVAPPWPRDLAGSSEPPLAAGRHPRSPSLPLEPLNGFPVSPSTFPSKPRSKPRPGTRYRVSR
jgi:hypothetical protein